MRLSDHVMAECGSASDIGGIFTKTAAAIRQAERFELTDDVARAAYNLMKSKPTTLLSAMPLCRAPHRKIWLEWRGGLTSGMIPRENKRDPRFAPDPLKQGCLIETDKTGQCGTMTFAWVHRERPDMEFSPVNVAPLGTLFNWASEGNVVDDAMDELRLRYPTSKDAQSAAGMFDLVLAMRYSREMSDEAAKRQMERSPFYNWGKLAGTVSERKALRDLNRHHMPWISPHALGFYRWVIDTAISNTTMETFIREVVENSWEADIEGEPSMVETVIAMMNSRNAIETRPVDLSGLNKARAKRRKPLFLPYRTTHLRLSQAQNRAFRAGLLTREEAGLHSVRGHFKIRKTGVYWWSPFERGDRGKPLARSEYKVES